MIPTDKRVWPDNPVIRHNYTCDPTVIVYDEQVYLYTGHDEAQVEVEDYVMQEWLCFSSADIPLQARAFSWAKGDVMTTEGVRAVC